LNLFSSSSLQPLLQIMQSIGDEYEYEHHGVEYPPSEGDDEWIHSTASKKVVS